MADIEGGRITVNGVDYTVILRPAGDDVARNLPMGGGKKSKKEKKGKSTRKLSSYMKFAQEARKKVVAEHPEMRSDIIAVGKKIGEMWRGLSDAEKARY